MYFWDLGKGDARNPIPIMYRDYSTGNHGDICNLQFKLQNSMIKILNSRLTCCLWSAIELY